MLLLAIGAGWAFWRSRHADAGPRIGSLAVLPLLNLSGDPRAGVDAVVEGSVLRSGDHVRVTAQLIRAATDEHLWAETYERSLTDILALQNEIARTVAGEVRIKVTPQEQARLTTSRSVDPEAYSLYLKGRYHYQTWDPEHLAKAITAFEQATQRDSNFALGYAALAEVQAFMAMDGFVRPQEAYSKARTAVGKALVLDPDLPEALAVLGAIQFTYDWDFAAGEKTLRRAVELGPSSLPAHTWYALCLTLLGRFDEAVALGRRMLELDPVARYTNYYLGWIYLNSRRFDEAIAQLEKTHDLHPNDTMTEAALGAAYAQAGRYPQALVVCGRYRTRTALGLDDAQDMAVAWSYAVSGRRDVAIEMLEAMKRRGQERYVDPYLIAQIYSGLGDNERAFEWLAKAYAERSLSMPFLKVGVFFNAEMKRDPRYGEMVRRVGLPVS